MGLNRIQVYDKFDEALISHDLATGDAAWVPGTDSVWIRNGDGEVDEVSPCEHPGFVTDGSVYAWHPDEGTTADDASCAGDLGHIANIYFAYYFDEWIGLGTASSTEEGLDHLRDHLGVLDPSWLYLEDPSR